MIRLEEGGTCTSPRSSVSHTPVPLHMLFLFLQCHSHHFHLKKSHLCFQGLLSVSHTPVALMPKHDNLLPLPLASFGN